MDRLLNKVVNVDYPEIFHSFLVMGCPADKEQHTNVVVLCMTCTIGRSQTPVRVGVNVALYNAPTV